MRMIVDMLYRSSLRISETREAGNLELYRAMCICLNEAVHRGLPLASLIIRALATSGMRGGCGNLYEVRAKYLQQIYLDSQPAL